MPVPVASLAVGAFLLTAAVAKAADRPGAIVALATYGLSGRAAHAAWALLAAGEALLGAAVLTGIPGAGLAAAGALGLFAAAQAGALASGRAGAPCGCLGGHGRLGAWSVARALLLAGGALLAEGAAPAGWLAAATGAAAAGAGLIRRTPAGALDVAGEGPERGERLPGLVPPGGRRLVVFTSEGCMLCRRLKPVLARLERELDVHVLDEERDAAAWLAARVPGSPFALVLDERDAVVAKGTANTARQLRSLVADALPAGLEASRRGFLARAGTVAAGLAGAQTVGKLVRPGEAEAYHFCGHIYTTDSCPHPTGLPRIDARGFPLRARDGRPVDDLGRLVDRDGQPVDEDGRRLSDADGRPVPPATRTRVCTATGRQYGIPVRVDGAWYRCCKGRVRKLVDCCSTHPRRVNGDRALRGYCFKRRKVFCVMYFQTKVPC